MSRGCRVSSTHRSWRGSATSGQPPNAAVEHRGVRPTLASCGRSASAMPSPKRLRRTRLGLAPQQYPSNAMRGKGPAAFTVWRNGGAVALSPCAGCRRGWRRHPGQGWLTWLGDDARLGPGQASDHFVVEVEVGLDKLGREHAHPLAQRDVREMIGAEHLQEGERLIARVRSARPPSPVLLT